MNEINNIRIDKWLWAVRIFKTRSLATNACKNGKVLINSKTVKPSHIVKPGDSIEIRLSFISRTFKVLGLIEKRVSAKIAREHVEETTPQEAFDKLKAIKDNPFALRERGMGRPTKKDRRLTDKLKKWN